MFDSACPAGSLSFAVSPQPRFSHGHDEGRPDDGDSGAVIHHGRPGRGRKGRSRGWTARERRARGGAPG
ncbi:hypothetical protein [Streptomyces sp. NPDC051776]|uniref:hypothetical protein n=1 Tax=Streptomyces sp. NPDC051776 TaxID=3155414 RepID=UPI003429F3F3